MTSHIIGIDPGHTGSMVCLRSRPNNKWELIDELAMKAVPTYNVRGGKLTRKRVDILSINKFMVTNCINAASRGKFQVFLEDIGAKPPGFKGSARTEFQLARCFGAIEGMLASSNMNTHWWRIAPQSWKKHFLLAKEDKELAIERANEFLSASLPETGSKNYRISRAESCLIAIYGFSERWNIEREKNA